MTAPSITGIHHLSLSVTDLDRSVRWYAEVLGFGVTAEFDGDGFRRARLRHPDADVTLTLTRHDATSGDAFDPRRTGLDHLAWEVADPEDMSAWKVRLEGYGVVYDEHNREGGGPRLTLRDPDGIQLELFATA